MNNNGKIYNQTDDITLFGMRINLWEKLNTY
jgi:hypothetical protein